MFDAIALLAGLALWWVLYGVDCVINGGTIGYPYAAWTMPFYYWWQDLLHNLPFTGARHRLNWTKASPESAGNQEWADDLHRPLYFLIMGVFVPLLPWLIYRACLL